MGDIIKCSSCIDEINIDCPECHGLGVKEGGAIQQFLTDQIVPELIAGGIATTIGYGIHKGIQKIKDLKNRKNVVEKEETEGVLDAMEKARNQPRPGKFGNIICTACINKVDINCPECLGLGVKIAKPFNLGDEMVPCPSCTKNSIFGPGACPNCGRGPGESLAPGPNPGRGCDLCGGRGGCHADVDPVNNPGMTMNRRNLNPTAEQLVNGAGRLIRATAPPEAKRRQEGDDEPLAVGNCGWTDFAQTNREQCQKPIYEGDTTLHVSPESASGISRRRGTGVVQFCKPHTVAAAREMFDGIEDLSDDEVYDVLHGFTKDKEIDLTNSGHLREVKEKLRVPKSAISGEGAPGVTEAQQEFTGSVDKEAGMMGDIGHALLTIGVPAMAATEMAMGLRHITNSHWKALHMRAPKIFGGHGLSKDDVNHNNADYLHDKAHEEDDDIGHADDDYSNEHSAEWRTGSVDKGTAPAGEKYEAIYDDGEGGVIGETQSQMYYLINHPHRQDERGREQPFTSFWTARDVQDGLTANRLMQCSGQACHGDIRPGATYHMVNGLPMCNVCEERFVNAQHEAQQ